MTKKWHIAQLNVGKALFDRDDPRFSGFVDRLDEINALADASPGFVWRLIGEGNDAMDIQVADDPYFLINMSVWESVEALFEFTYKTAHTSVMAGRRQWFERPVESYMVLWWIPEGTIPDETEALERLKHLQANGPTPTAFTFKAKFPPPNIDGDAEDLKPDPYCVGWE